MSEIQPPLFKIRRAGIADAAAIARVHVDTWRTTYVGIVPDEHLAKLSHERSQARWMEHLAEHPDQVAFVGEEASGQVVGFASCGLLREAVEDYDGELYGLYILQAFQGKGLGRQLVRQVALELRGRGCKSLVIWALKENPACGFYTRLGGRRIAEKEIEIGGKTLLDVAFGWPELAVLCGDDSTTAGIVA